MSPLTLNKRHETPQFQLETNPQSSIYVKTSQKEGSPENRNDPNTSVYFNTEMSKFEERPMKIEENQR